MAKINFSFHGEINIKPRLNRLVIAICIVIMLTACSLLNPVTPPSEPNASRNPQTVFFSQHPSLIRQTECLAHYRQKYQPPHANQQDLEAAASFWRQDADFAQAMNEVVCLQFVYQVGKVTVEGFVIKPKSATNTNLPSIIFNRGGNWRIGMINYPLLQENLVPLARLGFIVIASQYRGAKVWSKSDTFDGGSDEFGGEDVKDVVALIGLLEQTPGADPNRIGMLGVSRGGMMTYMASKNNPKVKAIAVWAGVTDQFAEMSFRPEFDAKAFPKWIPDYANTKDQALRNRSVLYWLDEIPITTPVLLLHGDEDKQVSISNSIKLAKRLKQRGQQHKLIVYPKAGHDLSPYTAQAWAEIGHWFGMHLRQQP